MTAWAYTPKTLFRPHLPTRHAQSQQVRTGIEKLRVLLHTVPSHCDFLRQYFVLLQRICAVHTLIIICYMLRWFLKRFKNEWSRRWQSWAGLRTRGRRPWDVFNDWSGWVRNLYINLLQDSERMSWLTFYFTFYG